MKFIFKQKQIMRLSLLILFFFLKINLGFAQGNSTPCSRVNEFSIERRNQNYPFSQSKKILFVSYKESIES